MLVGSVAEGDELDARVAPGAAATPRTAAKKRRFSVTVRSSYTLGCWVT